MRDPAATAPSLLPLLLAGLLAGLPSGAGASGSERIEAELQPAEPPLRPFPRWTAPGRPELALALSGGGARGFAHVGVLAALEEEGVEVDALAGTSAGALAGAFLAAGYGPEEIEDLLELGDWNELFRGLDVRRQSLSRAEDLARSSTQLRLKQRRAPAEQRPPGLIAGHALDKALQRVLLPAQAASGGDFDRLAIPFRPVATDLVSGGKVAPASGPLATLVRGSSAVPGLMAPVAHDGALLVDGGLRENVPVETALEFGLDLVIAVDVSQRLDAQRTLGSPVDVIDRSLDIVMDAKTVQSLALAQLVLRPEVSEAPRGLIGEELDALIAAGRSVVENRRAELWSALEAATPAAERLRVDEIEVQGTQLVSGAVLRERLGLESSREVARWRVASELARLLNRFPFESGHAALADSSGRTTLRFVLAERAGAPSLRVEGLDTETPALGSSSLVDLRRASWTLRRELLEDGDAFTQLASAGWDGAQGLLRFESPQVERLRTEAPADPKLQWTNRRVSRLKGERFDYDKLTWRLDDLKAQGIVRNWRLRPEPREDGNLNLAIELETDRPDELALGVSYRDELRWAGVVRLKRGNLSGRGDQVSLTGVAAEELKSVSLRYGNPGGLGLRTIGYELGLGWRRGSTPLADEEQEYEDLDADEHESRLAWLSLVHRAKLGSKLDFGLLYEHRRLPPPEGGRGALHERTAASLRWSLDRQDRLLFPGSGGRVQVRTEVTLAGDELWRLESEGGWAFALNESKRTVLSPRAGFGLSDDADHRSFWFDPGGHRELYGFVPYGAAAPQYARAGLTLRHRLLSKGPVDLYAEAGADLLWTSLEDSGFDELDDRHGYGLSLTANVHWLGPLTVGWAENSDGADVWFVTAGFPFLDD